MATGSLTERVLAGDLRALARAASLIEYDRESGRELLRDLFPRTGRAITIGITGPPGAGKSTLVSALIRTLRGYGKTVAVLAVDPSSAFSRGAILGDRIRMQEHYSDPGVFIRSMATRGQLGGVASATLDLALLLDAAGWDFVLIETVGVGQDEIEVARLADVTIVVLVPGQGDDIQAIKAGVMEVADIFAINKADLPGVESLEQEIRFVQSLSDKNRAVAPAPIRRVVATEGQGIEELLNAAISIFEKKGRAHDRAGIWTERIREMLRERLLSAVQDSAIIEQSDRVAHREIDPFAAVENLIRLVLKEKGEQLGIEIDHLGIAVRGLDEALLFWEQQLGMPLQGSETVEAESVRVAMLPAGSCTGCPRIELLEPADADSTISKFLEKRGPGLHHVALKVDDLIATMAQLKDAGATLVNEPRIGAGGHQYVFVHPRSTGGVLLELIQR